MIIPIIIPVIDEQIIIRIDVNSENHRPNILEDNKSLPINLVTIVLIAFTY